MIRIIAVAAVAASLGGAAMAQDRVTTADGSTLNGSFAGVSGGKIRFTTDAAGEVGLDPAKVNSLTLGQAKRVWYQDGRTSGLSTGTIRGGSGASGEFAWDAESDGGAALDPLSRFRVEFSEYSLWQFTGFAGASALYSEGNSDELTYGANLAMKWAHPDHIWELTGSMAFGEKNGVRSTQRARGDLSYTWRFSDMIGVFARETMEHDQFQALRVRSTTAAGLKAFLIDSASTTLTADGGAAYVEEHYKNGSPKKDYTAGVAGLDFTWRMSAASTFTAGTRATVSLEQSDTAVINSYAQYATSVAAGLTASLRMEHGYVGAPTAGSQRTDLRLMFLLGWTFA